MKRILQTTISIALSILAVIAIGTILHKTASAAGCDGITNKYNFVNATVIAYCGGGDWYYSPTLTARNPSAGAPIFQKGTFDLATKTFTPDSSNDTIQIITDPSNAANTIACHAVIGGAVQPCDTDNNLLGVQQAKSVVPELKDYCAVTQEGSCKDITTGQNVASNPKTPFTDKVGTIAAGQGKIIASDQCEENLNNPLSFFLCPLGIAITNTVDGLTGFLTKTLTLTPLSKQGTAIQDGFTAFKNIANSVYVIIFLIIIFSNFFSTGLDSYSVKKMLPRLIAAVIVTQFGFLICSLMVDFSNVLLIALPAAINPGKTLGESITSNMTGQIGANGVQGFLTGIAYFIIVLILAIAILVIIIIALAYIIFRNVFLIVLVFLFPLAAAAWVLPQTQQYAKKWATWFVKLLLMGPIVALILASTVIIQGIFTAAGQGGDAFLAFIAVFVPFIGIAIIPKSLKWSGDAMAAAGKAVQGSAVGKVATGAVKKSAEEGGIAKAKGSALTALSAGSTSSFGRSMQAKGASYGAKSAKAKADMYDSLSVKDLTRLGNNGDTGAQKALRNKYRAKAIEAKQAFDAGFTMSPTEQAGFNELATAAGGPDYAASTQQWQTEKEAKVAGSNITTLQSTVALGTPSATNPTPSAQQQAAATQAQTDINNLYNTEVQYHQQNYEATGAAPSKTERENFNRLAHAAAGNTDPYNPSQHNDYYGQAQAGWTAPTPACWVAREVYGIHNPQWIEFREWMLLESPSWFRNTYIKHGEQFALWLKPHTYTKKAIKIFMDSRIKHSQSSK